MILYWYSEDRTGTLFADLLQGNDLPGHDQAVMTILPLRNLGKEGFEVLDPDQQSAGVFATVDAAKDAAVKAAEKWFDS